MKKDKIYSILYVEELPVSTVLSVNINHASIQPTGTELYKAGLGRAPHTGQTVHQSSPCITKTQTMIHSPPVLGLSKKNTIHFCPSQKP